ncbi:MAG: sensor histidine kinase [Dermatophilaceae bacterium]
MTSLSRAHSLERWRAGTSGLIREPVLERAGEALIAVASLTGLIAQVSSGAPASGYLALALTAGGYGLSCWRLWPGVLVAVCGPVVAGVLGADPVLVWTLTVFATFVWCLRGARALLVAPLVGAANYAAFAVEHGDGWVDPLALTAVTLTLASAAAGSAVAARRQYHAEARQRLAEARLTREAEMERRITEERLRIARDLHDMVGHQTAVVNMHLGAAEVHLPKDADRSLADLHAARSGVQAVIRETQRILDILRLSPGEDALAPNAAYDQLAGLVGSYRALGVPIEAHLDPAPPGLPADVSAATYRVVQEALTNAQKHGTGPVSLKVESYRDEIRITVVNSIRDAAQPTEGGYGLIGMRERLASTGGTLETGATGGVFTVTATMRTDGRKP